MGKRHIRLAAASEWPAVQMSDPCVWVGGQHGSACTWRAQKCRRSSAGRLRRGCAAETPASTGRMAAAAKRPLRPSCGDEGEGQKSVNSAAVRRGDAGSKAFNRGRAVPCPEECHRGDCAANDLHSDHASVAAISGDAWFSHPRLFVHVYAVIPSVMAMMRVATRNSFK